MKPRPLIRSLVALGLLLAAGGFAGCSKSEPVSPGAASAPAAPAVTADLANGRAVFNRVCAVCHQQTGVGVPGAFPPLAGSEILTAADPGIAIRIALFGLQGPVVVGGKTFNSVMPAQGPLLKDREIADAISYARSAWGNQASAVAEESVRAVRSTVKRETM